jgi:hypothetical protein
LPSAAAARGSALRALSPYGRCRDSLPPPAPLSNVWLVNAMSEKWTRNRGTRREDWVGRGHDLGERLGVNERAVRDRGEVREVDDGTDKHQARREPETSSAVPISRTWSVTSTPTGTSRPWCERPLVPPSPPCRPLPFCCHGRWPRSLRENRDPALAGPLCMGGTRLEPVTPSLSSKTLR